MIIKVHCFHKHTISKKKIKNKRLKQLLFNDKHSKLQNEQSYFQTKFPIVGTPFHEMAFHVKLCNVLYHQMHSHGPIGAVNSSEVVMKLKL